MNENNNNNNINFTTKIKNLYKTYFVCRGKNVSAVNKSSIVIALADSETWANLRTFTAVLPVIVASFMQLMLKQVFAMSEKVFNKYFHI